MEVEILWSDEDDRRAVATLATWAQPSGRWTVARQDDQARALLRLWISGETLWLAAQYWADLRSGHLTPEQLLSTLQNPSAMFANLQRIGGRQQAIDLASRSAGDLYALGNAEALQCYRGARLCDPYLLQHPGEAELGAWQVVLICVGGAALVASAWLVARETAPAWQAIESERAWSAARAQAEIETNRALIAAGRDPVLTDWAKLRAAGARRDASALGLFGAGAGVGAIALAGAYYGLMAKESKRDNPARKRHRPNPGPGQKSAARSRPKRRQNQQQAFGFGDPASRQLALPGTGPDRPAEPLEWGSTAELEAAKAQQKLTFYPLERYTVFQRRGGTDLSIGSWRGVDGARTFKEAQALARDLQASSPYPVGVTGKRRGDRVWTERIKRNPVDPETLHRLGTADADRAIERAKRQCRARWPSSPPPSAVDELAPRIGGWPTRAEWALYRAAWREQVAMRLARAEQKTATRRNPESREAAAKRRTALAESVARSQRRQATEKLKADEQAAKLERQSRLAKIREVCGRATDKLKASCRKRREATRAECRAKVDAARQGRKEIRSFASELRRAERAGKDREKSRRKAIERVQESDDAVRHNIPRELLPVWEKVKGSIKGSPRRSRTEAFLDWTEENADDVAAIVESTLPTDQEFAAAYAAWAEESAA